MSAYNLLPKRVYLFSSHKVKVSFPGPRRLDTGRFNRKHSLNNTDMTSPFRDLKVRCPPRIDNRSQKNAIRWRFHSYAVKVPNYIDQVFTTSKKAQKKKPVSELKTKTQLPSRAVNFFSAARQSTEQILQLIVKVALMRQPRGYSWRERNLHATRFALAPAKDEYSRLRGSISAFMPRFTRRPGAGPPDVLLFRYPTNPSKPQEGVP